ncbi:hypothetical protein CI109_104624 [Kwoniella shandongensis]|uniref:Uncharacterized protein n=1 Tax=Kwoniella shandongensis TaxID=1734106 RepID=A0A5M6BX93_9TREE|nr:uncharacterized protein CI109_004790 [Kwoniella shandongensis]KAA5526790.1 hypothetical protein CI109_004790 [Kwoniella shandongensis]
MVQTIPFSLSTLRSHSIFIPPSSSSSSIAPTDEEWELVNKPSDSAIGQKTSQMVIRDKDLLVAMDKEVRMMSLSSGEGWEVKDGKVGSYKTLKSPSLTFTIHQLIPNSTGRLLAVVGHHQIVVLVLPKTSYSGSTAGDLECRSIPIDEFQFSPSSNDAITKVAWHPWGEGGNSLWVLTSNGKLREYDILQPHDAVQTFHFLPEKPASSSKFTAVDPLSRFATSFAFSTGTVDFGPLMVYVLIANGDIYTMGPILPLHTELPVRYLQGLKAYTDARLAQIQREAVDVFGAEEAGLGKATFQSQWVESLVKQVKLAEEARSRRDEVDVMETPSRRTSILGRSVRGSESSPSRSKPIAARDGMVKVHPPHLTEAGGPAPGAHRALLRQGPAVFNPGPQEVGNFDDENDEDEELDQVASDLFVSEVVAADGEGEGSKEKETIIAIAWSGGRIDIGLEVEKPEPRWNSSRDPTSSVPVIPIIESVLLPFPHTDSLDVPSLSFLPDPLYSDVFYVQHAFGVDAINVRPWLDELQKETGEGDLPSSDVVRLVESASSPTKPIVGLVNFCNITLGYGLVALASSGQVAFVEMDLRIADSGVVPPSATSSAQSAPTHSDQSDPQSLLLAKPFDADRLIASIRQPNPPYNPSSILKQRLPDYNKPTSSITPEHLRVLGEISSQVQNRSEAIRNASQTIENRLDMQVKELQRQIKLLRECQASIEQLKETKTLSRAEDLTSKQENIAERLDGVLGSMAAEYKPQVGEVERKWFEELERLKMRVRGGGVVRGKALASRAQVLKEQLAAIKPILLESQKATRDTPSSPAQTTYGSKQLKPLEAALGVRSEELRRLIRRMEMLDVKVEVAGESLQEQDE